MLLTYLLDFIRDIRVIRGELRILGLEEFEMVIIITQLGP